MRSSSPTNRATPRTGRGKLEKVKGIENLYRYTTTGTFYAVFYRDGKTTKRSLKTTDRLTAKQGLAEVIRDAGLVDRKPGGVTTVGQLLDLHMETRAPQRDTSTQKKLAYISKLFGETWPGSLSQKVRDVKRSHVDRWISVHRNRPSPFGGKLSKGTLNEYIQFVRALFCTAVDEKVIARSPVEGVRDFRRDKPIRRTPTMREFRKIAEDLRGQVYNARSKATADFVEFLGMSGLGNGEAAQLKWGDFRFTYNNDRTVDWTKTKVHVMRQKTDRGFTIPVFPQLIPLMEDLYGIAAPDPSVKLFSIANARRALNNCCERLGLPRYGHRSLRRMFIENCIQRGIDVQTIALWQGHSDNGQLILSTYAHVRQEFSDSQAAKLTALSME